MYKNDSGRLAHVRRITADARRIKQVASQFPSVVKIMVGESGRCQQVYVDDDVAGVARKVLDEQVFKTLCIPFLYFICFFFVF